MEVINELDGCREIFPCGCWFGIYIEYRCRHHFCDRHKEQWDQGLLDGELGIMDIRDLLKEEA